MLGELVPVCGEPETVSVLAQWASCNMTVLVFIVFVTILVLFLVALMSFLLLGTRSRY